ncbi:MAG: HmuY family protein [Bacteroidales bacterium]|nr:HmuY family protein [Bacteroidales bacterium]
MTARKHLTGPLLPVFLAASLLLTSCFEEDEIVPVHKSGELETLSVELGESYHTQVFLDLSTYSIQASNSIYDWDLAFECKVDEWHVILNSAKMMLAGNSMDTSFQQVDSDEGLEMNFDHSGGDPDSTAIGQWYDKSGDSLQSLQYVYVIDLGLGPEGQNTGKRKTTLDIEDGNYLLRHAALDGSDEQTLLIEKASDFSYVYFSFDSGTVPVAPEKDRWSLKCTRYSTMLITDDGEQYPYLVTGVLINPYGMSVAMDSSDFFSIKLQDTIRHTFSSDLDIIGYDWKFYSFDNELYTIVPDKNYIIRNIDGYYYKLRFISFYDESGIKGTTTMEVMRL